MVLAKEILGFLLCLSERAGRQVQFIDHQDDDNSRIRLCGDSIERLKGDNVRWLAIVSQREVLLTEAGHWISRLIRHYNIKSDHPLGRVGSRAGLNLKRLNQRGRTLLHAHLRRELLSVQGKQQKQ